LYRYFVSSAAITLCVVSQRAFIVVNAYFVVDSVRKLLDTLSYRSSSKRIIRFLPVVNFKNRKSVEEDIWT
jgi:hypothetical protein